MAISGLVASIVGVFALLSIVNGQLTINTNNPLPACSARDSDAGIHSMAHPYLCSMYIACNGQVQTVMPCPAGTLWDNTTANCNFATSANCPSWPCSESLVGRRYPASCCESYFECRGNGFIENRCPTGQNFNAAAGQCQNGIICTSYQGCIRPPTATVDPRVNCTLEAEPGNVCAFRTRDNGVLSETRNCGEGTQFTASVCGCTPSTVCSRPNSNINKVSDPLCRASFLVDFTSIKPSGNPQVFTEKVTGSKTITSDEVQAVGVQYNTNFATLVPNSALGTIPYFYQYSTSGNQLGLGVVISAVFRSTAQGSFGVFTNNREGACTSTIDISGTYSNSNYQFTVTATGATLISNNNWASITGSVNLNIQAGQSDYVKIVVMFNGRLSAQAINAGQSGTGVGQIVNAGPTGTLGTNLAYNKCGSQWFRNLAGEVREMRIHESCADFSRVRS
uniref:Chitin-binding type-2 domain-containing protein n=1 Tax=Arion vulgaris TaxID=1028688 RepID=A0A0B7ASC1_9EUPU